MLLQKDVEICLNFITPYLDLSFKGRQAFTYVTQHHKQTYLL